MSEISPGLSTKLVTQRGRLAVFLALSVEVDGVTSTVYLDENAMWHLMDDVKRGLDAATGKRIPAEEKRKRWLARAR